jgi:multicomponent Na+:H+ antiporter subunit E
MLPKLVSFLLFMFWEIIKANMVTVKESLYAKSKLETCNGKSSAGS